MREKYDLTFEEAQELESKTGLDVYSNDGSIFIDEKDITRTVGNALQFGMDYQREENNEAYDALHMTYLSQVGLYQSLYSEEKKKNEELLKNVVRAFCKSCAGFRDTDRCFAEGECDAFREFKKEIAELCQLKEKR